jgi:hypothetical protein
VKLSSLAALTLAALTLAGACVPAARPPPQSSPPPPSSLARSLDSVAWIGGDWLAEDERTAEHWTRAGDVVWGVALADDHFEVMTIDLDGDALRLTPAPEGKRSVAFRGSATATPASARFTNPDHDDPTSITYAHESGAGPAPERLVATLDGPAGPRTFAFTAMSDAPAAPSDVQLAAKAAAPAARLTSWRSLPEGHLAATLATTATTSHLVIWRHAADGTWTRAFEDRRP